MWSGLGPQREAEARALSGRRLHRDAAAVPVHDAAHRGQAHPGALEFAGVVQALEGFEQVAGLGHVEASAVVAHTEAAQAIDRVPAEADVRLGCPGAVLPGVVQQVLQYFADEVGVGHGTGWLLDSEADAAARVLALKSGSDGGGLGAEIDLLEADLGPGDAGQVQQVVENTSHVLAGGLDHEVRRLTRLLDRYTAEEFVAGIQKALAQQTFGSRFVRTYIDQHRFAAGLPEAPEPVHTGNRAADEVDVQPHDLGGYDDLF